jgi:hypothetical protein
MALGGPNIYPMIAGCSYPACRTEAQKNGYEAARKDLRDLLHKKLDLTAVIAWACDDTDQMRDLLAWRAPVKGGCDYSIDDCPFDWCAVHDGVTVKVRDTYYCTPTCVVGHERRDESCRRQP